MHSEQISVVIPCFNSGETIAQAVDSAKRQTWPSLEIIVVDDGSNDLYTLSVLNMLDGISLVRQDNKGLSSARNTGIRVARSEYILLLDSDDWLEDNAVEELMACLQSKDASCFAYSHIQLEGEASGVLCKSFNFFEQLFLNQVPYSLLMPYSLWLRAGGYDESMRNGYEDWEFNIRLASIGCLGCVVPKPLIHYRVRSSGMLLSLSTTKHAQLWAYIQSKHQALYAPFSLFVIWLKWRFYPSTYPLLLYFLWIAIFHFLPNNLFGHLFSFLLSFSQSRRITFRSNS